MKKRLSIVLVFVIAMSSISMSYAEPYDYIHKIDPSKIYTIFDILDDANVFDNVFYHMVDYQIEGENGKYYELIDVQELTNDGMSFNQAVLLVDRIDAASKAVEKAEGSKLETDIDTAQALVSVLPDGDDKTDLQFRLDSLQVILDPVQVRAIIETVTVGINEEYNLVDNLEINTLDATVTFASNSATPGAFTRTDGILTGLSQGRVTISAVVSKEGYISKTVSFEVLVAPVLLEWTDPSGDRITGEEETIEIDISLLGGVSAIEGVDIIMEWHKKVKADLQVIDGDDITLKDADGEPKIIENGFYRIAEGITIDSDNPSITSSVIFNNAGEYKLTVYAINE